MEVVLK